jgi:hypothetical protein
VWVVQEVLGCLLLHQQDFLHIQQGVAVGVEVEAVGNDADDADDDAVSHRHPHSQTMTVTSEGSLTSAKEVTCIKTRNTYPYCGRTFLVYLFIRFARISYRRFIATRYKLKRSTYIQEPLVIGRRGCVQTEI